MSIGKCSANFVLARTLKAHPTAFAMADFNRAAQRIENPQIDKEFCIVPVKGAKKEGPGNNSGKSQRVVLRLRIHSR